MNDDQAHDPIPFIRMAADVGIKLITNQANDPALLSKLRQILTDIEKELSEEEDREEKALKPMTIYHCYQCAVIFRNDPAGYINCLNTCVNP